MPRAHCAACGSEVPVGDDGFCHVGHRVDLSTAAPAPTGQDFDVQEIAIDGDIDLDALASAAAEAAVPDAMPSGMSMSPDDDLDAILGASLPTAAAPPPPAPAAAPPAPAPAAAAPASDDFGGDLDGILDAGFDMDPEPTAATAPPPAPAPAPAAAPAPPPPPLAPAPAAQPAAQPAPVPAAAPPPPPAPATGVRDIFAEPDDTLSPVAPVDAPAADAQADSGGYDAEAPLDLANFTAKGGKKKKGLFGR